MKHKIFFFCAIFLSSVTLFNQPVKEGFPVLKGPYLGQKPPGMTPEIFAPGIISTDNREINSVFSPDGDEFFFARKDGNTLKMYFSRQVNGKWTRPKPFPYNDGTWNGDMNYSPDGERLYFCSNRKTDAYLGELDIWYCDRTENGWAEPIHMGTPVNSESGDTYPVFTQNGGLYFGSNRTGSRGDKDLYYSRFIDGKYSEPIPLGAAINTEYGEGDTYVTFKEDFMVINSWGRPDGKGRGDLYVSFSRPGGSWSKAKNMGEPINTTFLEFCPMLSPDGKYLFFTSFRSGDGDIYWVDAAVIEELKPDASLSDYIIKPYEPGFEKQHKEIALIESEKWAWPFLSFTDIYSQPDFDPETALSCFKDGKMVGFVLVKIMAEGPGILKNEGMGAYLDIPRVLPGYEGAADLLMRKVIGVLKAKGAKVIRTRVSTMRKNSIQLAEKWGFQPTKDFPPGYKIYYTYNLRKGKLNYPTHDIEPFNKERDLNECAARVAHYFKMAKERVKEWLLQVDSREDLISHIVIRKNGRLEGYCFAHPHHLNPKIMATIYMDASNEHYLKQLIAKTAAAGIEKKHDLFLVDIIGHLLKYKETMVSLGFENAAAWGIYELQLKWPALPGPYFGQKAPSTEAEVFLDGLISHPGDAEMCAAFTADGKEFYYNALHEGKWAIFMTREIHGRWTEPTPMEFTSGYTDRDFTISPDGNKILFGSNRPKKEGDSISESLDIFVTERLSMHSWSKPRNIGCPINTKRSENYPSMAGNGNLYFFTYREDGLGGCDIYVSRHVDGRYQPPENLGPAVNSDKHDWDAFIAPDESFIIFSSKDREDSIGGQDLYISYRKDDCNWTQAQNMGPRVNSPYCEICPAVSLDGKFFFFTSRRRGKADIYWINAKIIEELKPSELK